jgi:hypothetical protein
LVHFSRNVSTLVAFNLSESGLINKKALAPVFVVVKQTNVKGENRILSVQVPKLAPKIPVCWVTIAQ